MVYAVIDTNIFVSALISTIIEHVKENGIDSSRFPYDGEMPDEDDRVFYEVCLSKEDSFLVTGNLKHFPKEPQVITAAEMMEILDQPRRPL
jgi:uncharacterized protein